MRYVIVGNGAAGVSAAETIRRHDDRAEIVIVGAEPHPMYSRPGLAYVLIDEIPWKQVYSRSLDWYRHHRLKLVHGAVTRLDVAGQQVRLEDRRTLSYHRLLIATGSRAVPAPFLGSDLTGVVYLDTLDGTLSLKRQAKRGRRAVVVGGGITALELTEGLASQGVKTHYFLRRNRLWGKVFNDLEAGLLEERMQAHGVSIHYFKEIEDILGKRGKVVGIRTTGDEEIACDLVGVAIGVRPQIDLVRGTPIEFNRGILVDEYMRSSVPNVYAAGDCAQVYDAMTRQHMLDVLWPSAVAEGTAAGMNMIGREVAYVKGVSFNACLLFGLHISVMGQINPHPDEVNGDQMSVLQHLSRGSSETWYAYPRHYHSAWSESGVNTVRLLIDGEYLVGALVIGDQSLADPLRTIIEQRINVRSILPQLRAGGESLRRSLEELWIELSLSRKEVRVPSTGNL